MTGRSSAGAAPTAAESGESALVEIRPGGERPPLVCVHGEAGHLRLFENLSRHLHPGRPVYGLRAVPRDLPPHAPYRRLEEMADRYVAELGEHGLDGPYLILGECNGAELAYELAQQLDARGSDVLMLVLVDSFGPGEPRLVVRPSAYRLANALAMLAFHLSAAAGVGAAQRRTYVATRVRRVVRRLRVHAATRTGPPPAELLRQGAYREAREAYRPVPYLGRVTLLRGTRLPWGVVTGRDLGWSRHAAALEIIELEAYFGTCLLEPVVARLGAAIERAAAVSAQPA